MSAESHLKNCPDCFAWLLSRKTFRMKLFWPFRLLSIWLSFLLLLILSLVTRVQILDWNHWLPHQVAWVATGCHSPHLAGLRDRFGGLLPKYQGTTSFSASQVWFSCYYFKADWLNLYIFILLILFIYGTLTKTVINTEENFYHVTICNIYMCTMLHISEHGRLSNDLKRYYQRSFNEIKILITSNLLIVTYWSYKYAHIHYFKIKIIIHVIQKFLSSLNNCDKIINNN